MFRLLPDTEARSTGTSSSSPSASASPLLSGLLDGSLRLPIYVSPPYITSRVSEPAGNPRLQVVEPEFFDCSGKFDGHLMSEESAQGSAAGNPSSSDSGRITREDEEDDITFLEDVRREENPAFPAATGCQSAEAAATAQEKNWKRQQDNDIVVLLSDSEGTNRPQNEFSCTDVPSIQKTGKEEVGDIVILEPTMEKELPASVCREPSSPRPSEELTTKPDELSEDTGPCYRQVAGSSEGGGSRSTALWMQQQPCGTSGVAIAVGSSKRPGAGKPAPQQLTCNSCLKLFSSRYELIRHVFVHFDDVEPPPHICVLCGEVFTSDEEVANHQESTRAQCYAFVPVAGTRVGPLEGVWFCSSCEQIFETKHGLADHETVCQSRKVSYISTCTEPPVSATELCVLPQVHARKILGNRQGKKHGRKRGRPPVIRQWDPFDRKYKRKPGRPRIHPVDIPRNKHKRRPGRPRKIRLEELHCTTPNITVGEPVHIKTEITTEDPADVRPETIPGRPLGRKPETTSGEPPRRKQGRPHRILQDDHLNSNNVRKWRRSPMKRKGETVNRQHKRKQGRPRRIRLGEHLCTKVEVTEGEPQVPLGASANCRSEITSEEIPSRKPEITTAEPLDNLPEGTPEEDIDRVPEMKPGESVSRKKETAPGLSASTVLEVAQEEPPSRTPRMSSAEILDRMSKVTLRVSLNRIPQSTLDKISAMSRGERLHRKPEMAVGESLEVHETTSDESCDEMSKTAARESRNGVPEMAPTQPLSNKCGVMPGEHVDGKSGTTPNHLIDIKPRKRRGRPPGSKNKGPRKPRCKNSKIQSGEFLNGITEKTVDPMDRLYEMTSGAPQEVLDEMRSKFVNELCGVSKNKVPGKPGCKESKAISGEFLNGIPETTVGKSLYTLQEMRPGDPMDRLYGMTPGMPLEILDEMNPRFRDGLCEINGREHLDGLDNLRPGQYPDKLHEMMMGEEVYKLHETAPQDHLYRLHEMPLDYNHSVTPRESLDKLHDMTQGEPVYRLHEMTTVESVHRLHEMSPVEILYRKHESTPRLSLDTIPKLEAADPLEVTPTEILYGNHETELLYRNWDTAPESHMNTVPKVSSGEPVHVLSEMAPAEPHHRLSEMVPAEPHHRLSEMVPAEPHHRLSEMAPAEPHHRLSEMASAEPHHRLSEMAPADPHHRLFEMAPAQSLHRLSVMAPAEPLGSKSITAAEFINSIPRRKRGRPPGSKNKVPSKPRCKKPKTTSGEPRDKIPETSPGEYRYGIPEIIMGAQNHKEPDKKSGEGQKVPCHFCRRYFSSVSCLKRHMIRHTGECNYVCDVCGDSFGRSDLLKVHKYTHTGWPFKCDICGKGFSWACHLRDHQLAHSAESSNVCRVCNEEFSTIKALTKHYRVHKEPIGEPSQCGANVIVPVNRPDVSTSNGHT